MRLPREKTQVNLYLDDEIIDWFRETVNAQNGGNDQTLIYQRESLNEEIA